MDEVLRVELQVINLKGKSRNCLLALAYSLMYEPLHIDIGK